MMSLSATLEARDLTFKYGDSPPVISGWSASFEPGTTTAITGASGSGKSTLLYLCGLMLEPNSGEVMINGHRADSLSDNHRAKLRARLFGFVFQDAALDTTRTVLDNVSEVLLYRGEDRERARSEAAAMLNQFGVNVPLDRRPGQVSGGQAQRIALCRALLPRPSILLADEPTGNLDPQSARVVIEAFRAHAEAGGTVVVVTHSAEVAAGCQREIKV